MPISQALLDVESYHIREVHLRANLEYDFEKPSTGRIDVDFDVFVHPEDAHRFQVAMSIAIGPQNDTTMNEPYSFHIHIDGYFVFNEETAESTRQKMMFNNGVPILYGIARGYVGQITGMAFNGPLVLPAVNFVEIAKRKATGRQEAEEAPEQLQLPK